MSRFNQPLGGNVVSMRTAVPPRSAENCFDELMCSFPPGSLGAAGRNQLQALSDAGADSAEWGILRSPDIDETEFTLAE
jgi:hypothetical protein